MFSVILCDEWRADSTVQPHESGYVICSRPPPWNRMTTRARTELGPTIDLDFGILRRLTIVYSVFK